MKYRLLLFIIATGTLMKAQCSWSLGVTSLSNNSFTLTCVNPILNLQATHNCTNSVTYQWNGPGTIAATPTVNIVQPGNYSLVVTDLVTSCANTQTFAVNVNTATPVFSLSSQSSTWTCGSNGGSYTATAISPTFNIAFSWYDINNPPPNNPPMNMTFNITSTLPPYNPGGAIVELRDISTGCTATQTVMVYNNTGFPTFSVTAAHGFQLGCWPADTMYITNVVLTNTNSSFSYSFMPPGNASALPLAGPLLTSLTPSLATPVPGTYTVVVMDNTNFCQQAIPVYIVPASTLNISYSDTVLPNGVVNFSSTSVGTNSNTTYLWDYGDGTTGTGLTSTHTYSNGGVHYVTLQTNNPNCVSSNDTVNVNTIPCMANSNFSLSFSGTPQYWYAVPDYYGNVISAIWSWGDGTSTSGLFPSHTYSAAGIYSICLTVTVSCANSTSTCANYTIYKMSPDQQMVNVTVVKKLPPVGINEISLFESSVQLIPNPASEYFLVKGIGEGPLNIYDAPGRLVKIILLDSSTMNSKINITDLDDGIYFLHFQSGKSRATKKLIITK